MKTGRLVTVPLTAKKNNNVKVQKSMKSITRILHLPSVVQWLIQKTVHILRPGDNLQNGAMLTLRCLIVSCWIKSFFFLCKKYSRRFITVRLDHWWKIEYPSDPFLDLDKVIYLAVNGTVTSLPVFIQNILNCVLKSNEAFTDLERHGGKWKTTTFSFWGGVSL